MPPKTCNFTQIRHFNYKKILSWYAGLTPKRTILPPYPHVVQIGDPTLRNRSEEVPQHLINSPEIAGFTKHLKHIFNKYNCAGLSAPQVGINYRIIMFELDKQLKSFTPGEIKTKRMDRTPMTVVINPVVKITRYDKVTFEEGCQSIKGFCAEVPRYYSLNLTGFKPDGTPLDLQAQGWLARIIQHEMDHIDGILYTDKMIKNTLACSHWQVINQTGGKIELPYSY